jgi:hypothetical protein
MDPEYTWWQGQDMSLQIFHELNNCLSHIHIFPGKIRPKYLRDV